jgi:PAS domain S-box-containing protein
MDKLREITGSTLERDSVKLRARFVLACLEGASNKEVAASFGIGEHTVSRWRMRFANSGIDGLRDRRRSGASRRITDRTLQTLVEVGSRARGARPSAEATGRLLGVSRSTVTRVWKDIRAHRIQAPESGSKEGGRYIRFEIVGAYFDRDLKIIAIGARQCAAISDAGSEGRLSAGSEKSLVPKTVETLLLAVNRFAGASSPNKATESVLAFVDKIRSVSNANTVHLLCFGARANWMEHIVSAPDRRGNLVAHPFDESSPWEGALDRAFKMLMRDRRMSHELRVPPKLLAAMRTYIRGGGALPPAARFSWPNIASLDTKQQVRRAEQAVTRADEASTDANGCANRIGDLELAFHMAPVGLLVSRQRMVDKYNQAFCGMFGYEMDVLTGSSLEFLYPSRDEFVHAGTRALMTMMETGFYSDERIMRRFDDSLFWCHVSGRAIDRKDPFAAAVWTFEDMSAIRPVTTELTMRERQIAQFLVNGKSSKQVARDLDISHRTVEAHKARLMRKYGVRTTNELIAHLIGRRSD